MKQLLQNISNGDTLIEEVPVPSFGANEILIKTSASLISIGTERMLVEFGKANLLSKAAQQPEKVRQVIDKISTDGIYPTLKAVNNKLSDLIPLGYCNVGIVEKIGASVSKFKKGDRVVSNGYHAEYISVGQNLCSKVPNSLSEEEAVFAVPGSIALNGIRLAKPQIGETFVVYGLGLIGLLAVQILLANGCRVIGIDFDEKKLDIAKSYGAITLNPKKSSNNILSFVSAVTNSQLADGVLICTSSNDNEIISNSANSLRKRGRIILIGTTGLDINRSDFYEKELSFQVSCSYGPGRYDNLYELDGVDYPYEYVRWTAGRNFSAILDLIDFKKINTNSMLPKSIDLLDSPSIYKNLDNSLGIIIKFNKVSSQNTNEPISYSNQNFKSSSKKDSFRTTFLGAGNYASSMLMPAFKSNNFYLDTVISKNGLSGLKCKKRFGFNKNLTYKNDIFQDDTPEVVVVATQHHLHSEQILNAMKNDIHNIFVEKPLCISFDQLDTIKSFLKESDDHFNIMVGFNRRFAPLIKKVKLLIDGINQPKFITYNINAGYLNDDHWLCDRLKGGGRLIGEVCHFIDLSNYIVNKKVQSFSVQGASNFNDSLSINIIYEDGSLSNINYFVNGSKKVSKEIININVDSKSIILDNFRSLKLYGWKPFIIRNGLFQNKGQRECVSAFKKSILDGKSAINLSEIFSATEISLKLTEELS